MTDSCERAIPPPVSERRPLLRRRKGFGIHVALFVLAQVLLFAIWDLRRWLGGTSYPWFLYALVGWGIILAAHYAVTRGDREALPDSNGKPRMKAWKAAALIAATLGLFLGGVYLFLERPWSNYSLVDMLTLFDSEKRAYNFQHMDQIFPAEPIAAAPVPYELPRKERPLPATYTFDDEERSLDRFLKETSTTGLLVIEGGTMVHESYYLGASASSRITSWSVAKSFVATLVARALAAGRIQSLSDPISAYAPALVGTSFDGVPIRDVLEMASGVDFDESYSSPFSDINLFFMKLFLLEQSANDVMDDYGRAGPPGKEFHYASIDTQALGMLVSAVYRQPLIKVLEDQLWRPLGARAASWNVDHTDGSGTPIAFCCINARLRDFAKLGQLYLQGGRWRGRRLLPAGWVREATTPRAQFLKPGALSKNDDDGQNGYGYQWWIPPGVNGTYMASGLMGQYIYVSEPDDVVIVRTSIEASSEDEEKEILTVFQTIANDLHELAPASTNEAKLARPQGVADTTASAN
jgi:CubicO group peptidase (beta-lactamase class C family)